MKRGSIEGLKIAAQKSVRTAFSPGTLWLQLGSGWQT
jgi:hypothetical protein